MIAPLLALLLAVQPTDLGRYREIVTATWWTGCCAPFRGGLPADIQRRIGIVANALERRHGHEATAALVAAARADFDARLALYDPVGGITYTPRRQRRERRIARLWYDTRLDALEAQLGLAGR
jgi:hypothetical protein